MTKCPTCKALRKAGALSAKEECEPCTRAEEVLARVRSGAPLEEPPPVAPRTRIKRKGARADWGALPPSEWEERWRKGASEAEAAKHQRVRTDLAALRAEFPDGIVARSATTKVRVRMKVVRKSEKRTKVKRRKNK